MVNRARSACRLSQSPGVTPRLAFAFSGLGRVGAQLNQRSNAQMHRFFPHSRRNGNEGTVPRLPACGRVHHGSVNVPALASIPSYPDSIPRASSSGRVKTGIVLPKTLATKATVLAIVSDAKEIARKEIIKKREFLSFLLLSIK